ncbi:MAG: sulfurtransferase TusA family protein [Desulfobulbaceae bacterium]|nr:sulfurtransferase TusA family protein [Desulfobulbaceae bacterium]
MKNDAPEAKAIEVDMRGQVCPSTLLVTMDTLNRNAPGLQNGTIRLLIITDNREALHTIPATAENMGYITQITRTANHFEILIGIPKEER